MSLKGKIYKVETLSTCQRDRMFELMTDYFDGMKRNIFDRDLAEKLWIILLQDSDTEEIQGFSTQTLIDVPVRKRAVKALFSGDTIIDKEYWGASELMRLWGHLVFALIEKYTHTELYWFLISMGYKTYRFLPVFFKEFYPCFNSPTPVDKQDILDACAFHKFSSAYDNKRGIIRPAGPKITLKPGIADIDDHLLRNPHIHFFVKKNPDHVRGYELACLAELTRDNFKQAAYRIMKSSIHPKITL